LPFVSGATIGFTLLLLFIGLGFSKVIELYPDFLKYLAIIGALFISYLGIMIASATPKLDIEESNKPTFMQGVLLQWLNPKAWIACMVGVSLFSENEHYQQLLTFLVVYFFVCYLSLFTWSVIGEKAAILLNSELKMKLFNQSMGGLLIVTSLFLLFL